MSRDHDDEFDRRTDAARDDDSGVDPDRAW